MNNTSPGKNPSNLLYTLRVSVAEGRGTTSPSGTVSRQEGTSVTVSATASNGYVFDHWIIHGTRYLSNRVTFTMPDDDVNAYAYFRKRTYTVSTVVSPSGAGYIDGGGTYQYDEYCTLRAHDTFPYVFSHWDSGELTKLIGFYVTSNVTKTAYYNILPRFTVSVNSSGPGTVSGGGTFYSGETCTVVATPNSGAEFIGWYDGNTFISDFATYLFTVVKNITLTAKFQTITYYVRVDSVPRDGGVVSGGGETIPYGQRTAVIAQANEHYTFSYWQRTDGETYHEPRWDFSVTQSVTCHAFFTAEKFRVTLYVNPLRSGEVSGDGEYSYNTEASINAVANPGYRFVRWSDGDTNATRDIVVTENITLTATFEKVVTHYVFIKEPNVNAGEIRQTNLPTSMPIVEELDVDYQEQWKQVVAIEQLGYQFVEWFGRSESGRYARLEFLGNYTKREIATFTQVGTGRLTLEESIGGTASVISHKSHDKEWEYGLSSRKPTNQIVTLQEYWTFEATPYPGYVFDHWERDGYNISTSPTFEAYLYGATEFIYKPIFVASDPTVFYTVKIDSNYYPTEFSYGRIWYRIPGEEPVEEELTNGPYTYTLPQGTQLRISHAVYVRRGEDLYYFISWSDGIKDDDYSYGRRIWNSLDKNLNLTMFFGEAVNVKCKATPNEGGYFIFRFGTQTYNGYNYIGGRDQNIDIQATAYQGYRFVKWVDTQSQVPLRNLTLEDDIELEAIFEDTGGPKQNVTLFVDIVPPNSGTVEGAGVHHPGETITIKAIPNKGYRFKEWGNGLGNNPITQVTLFNSDMRIFVYFTPLGQFKPYLLFNLFKKKNKGKIIVQVH